MEHIRRFYNDLSVPYRADAVRVLEMEWRLHNECQEARKENTHSAQAWLEFAAGKKTLDTLDRQLADALEDGTGLQTQDDEVEIRAWELLLEYVRLDNHVMEFSVPEHVSVLWATADRVWGGDEPARIRLFIRTIMTLLVDASLDYAQREYMREREVA